MHTNGFASTAMAHIEKSLAIANLRSDIENAPIETWDKEALQDLITERLSQKHESEEQLVRWVRTSLDVTRRIAAEEAAETRRVPLVSA